MYCNSCLLHASVHGGYGIKVITEACGASNSGSIPGSHPREVFLKIQRRNGFGIVTFLWFLRFIILALNTNAFNFLNGFLVMA